ncbi:galectin-4-like isoform X2 [Aotus nancymaae]|uniref:galectin-4-like isoform X2 n=1 Tax=Aotus nancymaae TaxID=37293 RepID=UPI0030FE9132
MLQGKLSGRSMKSAIKPEGRAERDHLNAATQRFTQKTGQNSEESLRRREQCHHYPNDPQLQVDFCTDMDGDSGIAFHFRVYFGHCVVMNSRECEVWKWEEKSDHVPFQDGMPFEVHIYVRHDEYQVTINGERIHGFGHRLPPSSVKMMRVWRDVSLSSSCGFPVLAREKWAAFFLAPSAIPAHLGRKLKIPSSRLFMTTQWPVYSWKWKAMSEFSPIPTL